MNYDGFDDLPENIKEAIKEMLNTLGKINPEDIQNMLSQLFGPDFMEKFQDLTSEGGTFPFVITPDMVNKFRATMDDIATDSHKPPVTNINQVIEEEPYYEMVIVDDTQAQLIVDLPGITDVRQVKWDVQKNQISIEAKGDDILYKLVVPTSDKLKTKDAFAVVKNGTFILPYKR